MNDIVNIDLNRKIAEQLILGKTPEEVQSQLKCGIDIVLGVFHSSGFVAVATDQLSGNVRSASLSALRNIIDISNDSKASTATRLKANTYLVDRALEFKEAGRDDNSPTMMSADQLNKRYEEFEKELSKRAKKIKAKPIIDNVEDMY